MSSTTKDKKDKQLPDKRSTTLPKLSNNSTNDKWIETKKRNLSSSNSDTTLSPKFLNSKSDADKNKGPNSLNGKTLNQNSPQARALNVFNNKSPKSNGSRTSLRNSLNGNNLNNGNNTSKELHDKKRKLMETLDNFGMRKRTRQESGVDAFVNRCRRTISESNAPDHVMNGHNHRFNQPTPTITNSSSAKIENKKIVRQGDFGTNICHPQKKPRTRNNEILSSYSSSKFLKPGQKRTYPYDQEDESPDRKHCKSCTCCGSTVLLHNDWNNSNKSDKTTETDMADDLVTVAASRIFNRSGKTQIVKKVCMKTILDEVFDDADPIPYTSIDKLEEKKKKAQNKGDDNFQTKEQNNFNNDKDKPSFELTVPASKLSESVTNSTTVSDCSKVNDSHPQVLFDTGTSTDNSKKEVAPSFTFGVPKADEKKSTPIIQFGATKTDAIQSTPKTPPKGTKVSETPTSTQSLFLVDNEKQSTPVMQFGATKVNDKQKTPSTQFGTPKVNDKQTTPVMQFGATKVDDKQSTPVIQFGVTKADDKQLTPAMQFGATKSDDKQSTPVMQFGATKTDALQSTPKMPFEATKGSENPSSTQSLFSFGNEKKSTPVIQFGLSKNDAVQSIPKMPVEATKGSETPTSQSLFSFGNEKQSTPVMQFGVPKVDDKQLTPKMPFEATKGLENPTSTQSLFSFGNEKQSTPVMQFGVPKVDDKQSTPKMPFEATKGSENPSSTQSLFSFGSNQKSVENSKPVDPVKFQFGTSKSDSTPLTESTNAVFGSNSKNKNIFNFGKTDNITLPTGDPPKYDAAIEKSTPKLQFGALPTPVFGAPTADQSKPQFNTSVSQPASNQSQKLVFGSQTAENKPTASAASSIGFANNTTNPIFQFNSSGSKLGDKPSETPSGSFPFTSNKTTAVFGASAPQDCRDKPAFQFNTQKTEETKTQFSAPDFGTQNTNAPFKFGGNEKPVSFGATFPTSNQPLQFTNNTEKTEPFKFGSSVQTSNAFQFSANKTDNGPAKFGQTSNTFPTSGFSGFGNSAPQQTTTFGTVQPPQPSPFGNITSPTAAPTFGSVASPSSNTFGTNQSFQFGSTNNAPTSSSTFTFGSNSQPTKPDGAFSFNATSTTASPFQFGQGPSPLSTPQFGGTQPNQGSFGFGSPPMSATVMSGSSQPLFSIGTAPAGERRKAKAVRRRQ
ncbi:hypothetical protein ACI65C_009547 [Semiaphis heraclei]